MDKSIEIKDVNSKEYVYNKSRICLINTEDKGKNGCNSCIFNQYLDCITEDYSRGDECICRIVEDNNPRLAAMIINKYIDDCKTEKSCRSLLDILTTVFPNIKIENLIKKIYVQKLLDILYKMEILNFKIYNAM